MSGTVGLLERDFFRGETEPGMVKGFEEERKLNPLRPCGPPVLPERTGAKRGRRAFREGKARVLPDYQGPGGNGVVEIGERAYAKFQWDLIKRLL